MLKTNEHHAKKESSFDVNDQIKEIVAIIFMMNVVSIKIALKQKLGNKEIHFYCCEGQGEMDLPRDCVFKLYSENVQTGNEIYYLYTIYSKTIEYVLCYSRLI
ncbi:unnamed protein product [Chrysodeixis includens]|uniref:Uncharacterized protein n=1 Tax=Chrysodeixis includens TaxID=689277 RepID=A0A9N8L5L2_CHRIL|nr:unnamed protein product [Chrysodeixis includens]